MKRSIEIPLPADSLLRETLPSFDVEDCFVRTLTGRPFSSPKDLLLGIIKHHPLWIQNLLLFRDLLLKPWGLKTPFAKLATEHDDFIFEIGNKTGGFTLIASSETSLVFSFEDTPLTAHVCLSLSSDKSEASLSSRTLFHNSFGKIYFLTAKPFHKFIFKELLNCV